MRNNKDITLLIALSQSFLVYLNDLRNQAVEAFGDLGGRLASLTFCPVAPDVPLAVFV